MNQTLTFEIANPSDQYTLVAPDLEVAAVACVLLGGGQYALDEIGGDHKVPLFLFGGHDEWFAEYCGRNFEATLEHVASERRIELADCLDSVLIGGAADRATFDKGLALIEDPAKREEWRQHWLDERRSSLNNIGGRAWALAAHYRKEVAA